MEQASQLRDWMVLPVDFPLTDILLVLLLIFGVLSYFLARLGPTPPNAQGLAKYESLPVAWPSILIVWALLALGCRHVASLIPLEQLRAFHAAAAQDAAKTLFVVYLAGFTSLWFVYFLSRSENRFFRTRTLRTLLANTSLNWKSVMLQQKRPLTPEEIKNFHEFEHIQKTKAQSSVQALSILAAAAAVVISLSSELRQAALLSEKPEVWAQFTLLASLVSGIAAFYCFVVAVDVLDTVFNRFDDRRRIEILTHLYNRSINPKYYGQVLLMTSLACYVAASQPVLGALALAVAMFTGYSHWFPRLKPRVGLEKLEWILRTFFVAVPIMLLFR